MAEIDEEFPRERVIHEREIITRDRSGPGRFLAALAGLIAVVAIVVIVWIALDNDSDDEGIVDDVQQEVDDFGDDVQEGVDDAQADLSDGQ